MRFSTARWMFGLCFFIASGCSSTSKLPTGLASNPNATESDVTWRKANAPSTSMTHEQWNAAEKREPIQATTFQDQTASIPPVPDIMRKDSPPQKTGVHPVIHKHSGKYTAASMAPPLPDAPNEYTRITLPTYQIRPPDVLLIESLKGLLTQPVRGQHLVRVDGTVGLGIYGPAQVSGKTIQEAREEIARVIAAKLNDEKVPYKDVLDGLSVDVLAYNSSVYYIITDGAGLGEQVYRFPVTGSETVLDAIANINGLPV